MGPLTGVRCFILFSIEMAAAITQLNTCLGNATTQAERDACWLAFEAYIFTRTGALLVCLKRELSNPLP
jgi:hypothetical protein